MEVRGDVKTGRDIELQQKNSGKIKAPGKAKAHPGLIFFGYIGF